MSHPILLTRHGRIALLTLDRSESLNSLSLDAIKQLLEQLRALAAIQRLHELPVPGPA